MSLSLQPAVGLLLIVVIGFSCLASYFCDCLVMFLVSMLFVLIRLCIKSHFLSLIIVTNLFHSLLNAFQC